MQSIWTIYYKILPDRYKNDATHAGVDMLKYKDYIPTFLNHPKVPPYNNGSEKAIRSVKVKHKVPGHFKSWKGV